jgi:hypothetical protein
MISKKKLNDYLATLSKEELIKEVEKLFQKFPLVQQYYAMDLGEDSTSLLEEYKRKMEKIFFPRGFGVDPKMSEANKLIKEFSKIAVYVVDVIDLMLYKAELSIKLFQTWGGEFPTVENSLASTYNKAIDLIHKHHLEEHFMDRCSKIEDYGINFGLLNKTLLD